MNRLVFEYLVLTNAGIAQVVRKNLNPKWKDVIKLKLKVMGITGLEGVHLMLAVWDKVKNYSVHNAIGSRSLFYRITAPRMTSLDVSSSHAKKFFSTYTHCFDKPAP